MIFLVAAFSADPLTNLCQELPGPGIDLLLEVVS